MLHRLTLLALGFLIVVSGCAASTSEPPTPIKRPQLIVPDVDIVDLREINWIIVTNENYEQVIKDNAPLFALTEQGVKAVMLNMSDLLSLVEQQEVIIAAYKDFLEEPDENER